MRTRILATTAALSAAALLAGVGVATTTTSATETRATAVADAPDAADIMIVAFHADWCGKCQTLGPKLQNEVFPAVTDEPVLVVKLDFTDSSAKRPEYLAAALGIDKVWEKHGRSTGFAVVLDAKTKRVIDTFHASDSPSAMKQTLRGALDG